MAYRRSFKKRRGSFRKRRGFSKKRRYGGGRGSMNLRIGNRM